MLICGHHIIIMCGAFELLCICEEIAIDENINSRSRVSFVVRGAFFFNFILSFVLSIAPNTAYLQFCYYSIQELITITSNCHQQSFLIHPLSLSAVASPEASSSLFCVHLLLPFGLVTRKTVKPHMCEEIVLICIRSRIMSYHLNDLSVSLSLCRSCALTSQFHINSHIKKKKQR